MTVNAAHLVVLRHLARTPIWFMVFNDGDWRFVWELVAGGLARFEPFDSPLVFITPAGAHELNAYLRGPQ